jgi:hypothetical protein
VTVVAVLADDVSDRRKSNVEEGRRRADDDEVSIIAIRRKLRMLVKSNVDRCCVKSINNAFSRPLSFVLSPAIGSYVPINRGRPSAAAAAAAAAVSLKGRE